MILLTSYTLRTTGLETLSFKGCFAWTDSQNYQNLNQDSQTTSMSWHLDLEAPEFSGAKAKITLSSRFMTLLSVAQFLCLLPSTPTWLGKNIKNKASFDYLIFSQFRHFWGRFLWQNSQLSFIYTIGNELLVITMVIYWGPNMSQALYRLIALLLRTLRHPRCVYCFSTTPLMNPPDHNYIWLHYAFSHLI